MSKILKILAQYGKFQKRKWSSGAGKNKYDPTSSRTSRVQENARRVRQMTKIKT